MRSHFVLGIQLLRLHESLGQLAFIEQNSLRKFVVILSLNLEYVLALFSQNFLHFEHFGNKFDFVFETHSRFAWFGKVGSRSWHRSVVEIVEKIFLSLDCRNEYFEDFLGDEGDRPVEKVHEVWQIEWLRRKLELLNVQRVVLVSLL